MLHKVLLVMSGTYCQPEVMAEFGRVPPSFLPLGGKRLFEHQAALGQRIGAKIALTLPDDFQLAEMDATLLDQLGVQIIRSRHTLSLHNAVLHGINQIGDISTLYLLHGDTLVEVDEPGVPDRVASSESAEFYQWADIKCDQTDPTLITGLESGFGDGLTERQVACGLFSFSRVDLLRTALAENDDFVTALHEYAKQHGLHTARVRRWYDLGHLPLVYASRRDMLISRSFNTIRCDGRSVLKASSNARKIEAEAFWFENLPADLRPHVPRYMGREVSNGRGSYRLEYLSLPTLAELSVFGRLPGYTWRRILTHTLEFMEQCRTHLLPSWDPLHEPAACEALFQRLIGQKSRDRFLEFLAQRGWGKDITVTVNGEPTPPLIEVIEHLVASIRPTAPSDIALVHGDLFFGNMLYDFRSRRILVIDPRGSYGDDIPTLYSDMRYDVAKLAHSILGDYDRLLAGRGAFHEVAERRYIIDNLDYSDPELIEDFLGRKIGGMPLFTDDIAAMTALLFFSMLPLHAESPERQNSFLAMGVHLSRLHDRRLVQE